MILASSQLIFRWLSPAFLLVYRRMGSKKYSDLTSVLAMLTTANTLESHVRISRVSGAPGYLSW